jgi:hypothetical protein
MRQDCDGSRLAADKLLIRPADGDDAVDTDERGRTDHA